MVPVCLKERFSQSTKHKLVPQSTCTETKMTGCIHVSSNQKNKEHSGVMMLYRPN